MLVPLGLLVRESFGLIHQVDKNLRYLQFCCDEREKRLEGESK